MAAENDAMNPQSEICIAGGGPAGMVLGYLLARCGIDTVLLESQKDFDRDFRGDTLHAGVMEIFETLGLADRILELPHSKIRHLSIGETDLVNFSWIKTPFPYVTMMAQSVFLRFLAEEAAKFPSFRIEMGAQARALLRSPEDENRIVGLRYRQNGQAHEIAASLVIACDGRGSRLRKEAGLTPTPVTDPLEVLWFRLPRDATDGDRIQPGALAGSRIPFILLVRPEHYQIAAIIKPGNYSKIRAAGLESFHRTLGRAAPLLFDRARRHLRSWSDLAFLHVEGSRLSQWHCSGLLFLGDAAHTMTPVGGVGINYAIWDAVEAANVLVPRLTAGQAIQASDLAEVQRCREKPTRWMQTVQRLAGRRVVATISADPSEAESDPIQLPLAARLVPRIPILRNFLPRLIALGWRRTHCRIGHLFKDSSSISS